MNLVRQKEKRKWHGEPALSGAFSTNLFVPVDHLLACGGDQRLNLTQSSRQNAYGCTPYPRPELVDFASSTASCISEEAYAHALRTRDEYLANAISDGAEDTFKRAIASARRRLLTLLGLENAHAKVVFSASGTDAQLQALFLAKGLLGSPLTTVVVGSDQTGSGTAYTSCGRHFSHVTAAGHAVEKDQPIAELADGVSNINITFRHAGGFRTPAEMDTAVISAIEAAVAKGTNVVLQTMDASKFGWRAPSDACVEQIVRRWPKQVQVVVDACQLRCSRGRLREFLARGFAVLITGSKFFTGPAFSGALIVPAGPLGNAAAIMSVPSGLSAYASAFDWPEEWISIRACFPAKANFGQWLRWEAALEEMRLYYAIPASFREHVRASLAVHVARLIKMSTNLRLLSYGVEQLTPCTMFPVLLHRNDVPLTAAQCTAVYRALRSDLSTILCNERLDVDPGGLRVPCQTGQPVLLSEQEGTALRISLSSRTIRQCWSDECETAEAKTSQTLAKITTLFEKLHFAIHNIESIEAQSQ
jgi:hypothetical protein